MYSEYERLWYANELRNPFLLLHDAQLYYWLNKDYPVNHRRLYNDYPTCSKRHGRLEHVVVVVQTSMVPWVSIKSMVSRVCK